MARTPAKKTAPSTSSKTSSLPAAGSFVRYDATDPLTGDALTGIGIVLDAYTHGEGDDRISRVNLARLTTDLNLSADAVSALG